MSPDKLEAWLARWVQDSADAMPARWRRWLAMHYPDARLRRFFWRRTGVEMGEGTFPSYGMILLDDHATTGQSLLRIGAQVTVGPGAIFVAVSGPNNSPEMQAHSFVAERLVRREAITVEDHAWLGARATILPGVTIGRGAVIAAGSVVTESAPPFSVVAGTPARVVRRLEPFA